jgi:protein phosphatase
VLQVALATDVGRVRHHNEDYALAERVPGPGGTWALWLVADGVGGGPQGERASLLAVETVVEYLATGQWVHPAAALTEGFALANDRVHTLASLQDAEALSTMATTLVAALVDEASATAYIANVGDSRAYLYAAGQLTRITQDHSLISERLASGELTDAEARLAAGHNVLTRGIGSDATVAVDVFGPRVLRPGERLLLCSDGLHGMIDDGEIARRVGGASPQEVPALLVAAANDAGGRDNVTALIGGLPAAVPAAGGGRFAIPGWGSLTAALAGGLLLLVVALVVVRAFSGSGAASPALTRGGALALPGPTSPHALPSASVAPASVAAVATPAAATTVPAPTTSAQVSSPPPPLRVSASPVNFSATAQGSTGILLRWVRGPVDASHSAPTGYRIVEYRSLPEWQGLGGVQALEAPPRTIGSPTPVGPGATSYQEVSLTPGTTHCYATYAANAAGSSPRTPIECVGLPPVFYAWALSLAVGVNATSVQVGKAVQITARAELLPPSAAGEYPLTKWTVSEVDTAGQASVVKTCSTTSSPTQTCLYKARFLSPTTMQFRVDGYTRERDWAHPPLRQVQVTISWAPAP